MFLAKKSLFKGNEKLLVKETHKGKPREVILDVGPGVLKHSFSVVLDHDLHELLQGWVVAVLVEEVGVIKLLYLFFGWLDFGHFGFERFRNY